MRSYIINLIVVLVVISVMNTSHADEKYKKNWPNTDFDKSSIDYSRLINTGPPKEGLKSIDEPYFKIATEIDDIPWAEPVITVYLHKEARAYPLRMLLWHEIVNDKILETPIVVTYSPLTNTSMVFERVIDSKEVQFGFSGKLYNSNSLIYDRYSESWWQQYTGESVVGKMLGEKLKRVLSRVESLYSFKDRYPEGKVMVPREYIKSYGASPYWWYDTSKIPFLYDGIYNGSLPMMEYLVVVGDEAWPLKLIKRVGGTKHNDLIIKWISRQHSVLNNPTISLSHDIGNVVVMRAIGKGLFKPTDYSVTFAFVFDAFHPDGVVHEAIKVEDLLK